MLWRMPESLLIHKEYAVEDVCSCNAQKNLDTFCPWKLILNFRLCLLHPPP